MKKGKEKKNRSFESKSNPSSPNDKRIGNSPKRSRTEDKHPPVGGDVIDNDGLPGMEFSMLENVASQVTIMDTSSSSPTDGRKNSRWEFIKSQKKNKYSSSNHPPFLVHVESTDGNIGNVHPMRIGKALADHFSSIRNIRKLGKNILAINFKFSFDANQFVVSNDILPDNWVAYIPNYKIIRTGIARGVDPTLSVAEILQGIKWRDRPLERERERN